MSRRICSGTERALKKWKPGMSLDVLAVKCGISPSTLYRALVREGLLTKRAPRTP